ncbi:hypothetical protein CC2G_008362 [Coprinopsis cinerea AmutBmut pab1-1]|nr:hypothetical protein CC2G_008362 [Coprinopsis cinerea AmutBmut pab1-1]
MSPKGQESVARRIEMMGPILEKDSQSRSDKPLPSVSLDLLESFVDNSDEDFGFESIELLPGGRFILLFSAGFLHVWDLAPYLQNLATPIERRLDLPWNFAQDAVVLPALGADTTSVRFMLSLEPFDYDELYAGWDPEKLKIFQIMELNFTDGDLQLRKIGDPLPLFYPFSETETDIDAYEEDLDITENYVLFRIRRTIIAWNFQENAYVAWDLIGGDSEMFRFQISLAGDKLLVFEDDKLTVYEIPPLMPLPEAGSVIDVTQLGPTPDPSQISVSLPGHALICDGECEAWRGFAGSLKPSYYYVHHVGVSEAATKRAWYRISIDLASQTPVQVTDLGWDVARDLDGLGRFSSFHRPYKGKLIATSIWVPPSPDDDDSDATPPMRNPQSASVYVSVSDPSRSSTQPIQPRESILLPMAHIKDIDEDWDHEINCDFCPLSGILVVTTRRYRGPEVPPAKRIQVFDFVRSLLR